MKLLTSLDKKPFQTYSIQIGINKSEIKVPLEHSANFEKAFDEAINFGDPTIKDLLEVVKSFGGSLRKSRT